MKNCSFIFIVLLLVFSSCTTSRRTTSAGKNNTGYAIKSKIILKEKVPAYVIDTKNIQAETVVKFAETLQGTPYLYGSAVKEKGFDCSGFINYVFMKHKIKVPRISKDFTNAGIAVSTLESKRGDIILFTGSDVNNGVVGHMGIVIRNDSGRLQFIHASSGQGGGVMISSINSYFLPRFVKVIRVFNSLQ
ncbi:MAG: C40 family peptidase [Ferruginibacter sp.]